MAAGPWIQKEENGGWKLSRRLFSLSSWISDTLGGTLHACKDSGLQMASVIVPVFLSPAPKWSLILLRGQKALAKEGSDVASRVSPRQALAMTTSEGSGRAGRTKLEHKRRQRWPPLSRKNAGESPSGR